MRTGHEVRVNLVTFGICDGLDAARGTSAMGDALMYSRTILDAKQALGQAALS